MAPRTAARDDGIQVLRRAAAALDEIATAPGRLRLVDLQDRLGLAKSTVRRLLVGLVEIGFAAVDDDGRISLGGRLLGLGSADAAQIATTFRPTLERVAELTGETVDLSILRAGQMWFIDQIESGHRLRAVSAVGDRFPLHDTANGKAALALLGAAEVDDLLAHVAADRADIAARRAGRDPRRPHRLRPRRAHRGDLGRRGRGPGGGGNVVAISVPAPTDRFAANEKRIVAALRSALAAPAWLG